MSGRVINTEGEAFGDKYRVYLLRFEDGSIVKLHVGRPISFKTFVETFIFQHMELVEDKSKTIFQTKNIMAVEKIPNSNKPDFQITAEGMLLEIS